MKDPRSHQLSSKWAVILSLNDMDDFKRKELRDFSIWYMDEIRNVAKTHGIHFNYENTPTHILETTDSDLTSCESVYNVLKMEFPQVICAIHIFPYKMSKENDSMQIFEKKYTLIRQGVFYEDVMHRFEGQESLKSNYFIPICSQILKSAITLSSKCEKNNRIIIGRGKQPTIKKILYNSEDIHTAVTRTLLNTESDCIKNSESAVAVSGYPEMLNSFGVAQLLTPYRVLSVVQTSSTESTVLLENKFQAYQAACDFNKKVLSRNNILSVKPLGPETAERFQSFLMA